MIELELESKFIKILNGIFLWIDNNEKDARLAYYEYAGEDGGPDVINLIDYYLADGFLDDEERYYFSDWVYESKSPEWKNIQRRIKQKMRAIEDREE